MSAKALTQIAISSIKPGASRREIPDGKIGGLYFVVQPTGASSWALRYRSGGQPKKLTIGSYPAIDLAAARRLAGKAASTIAEGGDPAAAKQASRLAARAKKTEEVHTVAKVVETFLVRHVRANTRASSAREVERLLRKEAIPFWGARPLASITRADVHGRLDEIVDRGAAVMANRFLAAFRKMCEWSVQRDILATNPCAGLRAPTAEVSRDRVLTDDELKWVWIAAGKMDWPFGPIIRLLLLTGQRKGEVVSMRWSDVDLAAQVWTIPKERAKNGIEHVVHLSRQAVSVLEGLPTRESRGLVFTMTTVTPVSGFTRAKARLDRYVADQSEGPVSPFVLHDLRRTMASGMARLGVNLPAIEKVLNHTSGSFGGIVGVYQRHSFGDEKRAALDLWARHVEAIASGSDGANIISLRTRAN